MRGSEFLGVATHLKDFEGEAWTRTRISRLYYGVYLEIRQFCVIHMGLNLTKLAREHQIVSNLIGESNPKMNELLRDLRMARNRADYDLHLTPNEVATLESASEEIATRLMVELELLETGQE